jgi:hypothetical protein
MKNTAFIYILSILLTSCVDEEKLVNDSDLMGDWLITEAEPQYKDDYERQFYVMSKDSIRALKGLKLISIKKDAVFQQMDSLNVFPGSWLFNSRKQQLVINNGGMGFSNYIGLVKMDKAALLINERVELGPVTLGITWHLKKILSDSPAAYLFIPANNAWRIKPAQPEEEGVMKKRLSSMFHYYSLYFTLVSREADYFSPKRVMLPIRYYQHGVGMRDLEMVDNFKALFFDEADFKKAYTMIELAIKAEQRYPSGKDFTEEYAAYFRQLESVVLR